MLHLKKMHYCCHCHLRNAMHAHVHNAYAWLYTVCRVGTYVLELSLKNLETSINNDPLFHATGLQYFIVLFPKKYFRSRIYAASTGNPLEEASFQSNLLDLRSRMITSGRVIGRRCVYFCFKGRLVYVDSLLIEVYTLHQSQTHLHFPLNIAPPPFFHAEAYCPDFR
jgi:hypothetical protein